ncbi:MAG TPA: hypothetical protein VGD67_21670 [Pseudonocardiaceae bacterium]
MKLMRTLLACAAVGVAVMGSASPAQAHSGHWISVYNGSGIVIGQAMFEGSFITVCDRRVDGNSVRAHLLRNDGQVFYTGWAPSQSCTREGHPSSILQFRVCAENNGCSAWHNRY